MLDNEVKCLRENIAFLLRLNNISKGESRVFLYKDLTSEVLKIFTSSLLDNFVVVYNYKGLNGNDGIMVTRIKDYSQEYTDLLEASKQNTIY